MGRLSDRVALITGGARGQGEAEVRLFHREGARVVIADVLEERGKALGARPRTGPGSDAPRETPRRVEPTPVGICTPPSASESS